MKLFTFLLAVMVFALSCVPCMDGAFTANDNKAKAEISKSSEQKNHTDADNCSPFCACNCCTGFTLAFNTYKLVHPVLNEVDKASIHLPAKITSIALPIWQPPQLG
ncbi:DUF6660 family protein [Limnovirga soli]|uniref:Uncharacterized protein n=1 Tax=Limnovirga soli TaxID=2656915 RepID=A0A8J8JVW3_9BACT|nr:DUF6660 family protein [Limnovirga soli]NNV57800.1 hypothetical protein [Limnovirga soli]